MYLYYPGSSIWKIIAYRIWRRIRSGLLFAADRIWHFRDYAKLKTFKGSARGRSAFVFANGPSMKILDPRKIKGMNFDIFAVNGYLWTDFAKIAPPTHYVLSDPGCFYMPNKPNRTPHILEVSRKYIPLLDEIESMAITLFVPTWLLRAQKNKNAVGFCDVENEFSKNVSDVARPRGYITMTAYKALAIALYMQYEKIYICGMDNDYFKWLETNETNQLFYNDRHFFDNGKKTSTQGDGDTVGEFLYHHHFLFAHFSKFPGRSIVNLDKNSLNTHFSKGHDLDVYQ
jgi:hypothetical protein